MKRIDFVIETSATQYPNYGIKSKICCAKRSAKAFIPIEYHAWGYSGKVILCFPDISRWLLSLITFM